MTVCMNIILMHINGALVFHGFIILCAESNSKVLATYFEEFIIAQLLEKCCIFYYIICKMNLYHPSVSHFSILGYYYLHQLVINFSALLDNVQFTNKQFLFQLTFLCQNGATLDTYIKSCPLQSETGIFIASQSLKKHRQKVLNFTVMFVKPQLFVSFAGGPLLSATSLGNESR